MQPHRVVAVLEEHAPVLELGIASEIFGFDRPELADPWYRYTVASPGGRPVTTGLGVQLQPESDLSVVDGADTVVILPGRPGGPSLELLEAIRRAHARGARLVSLCTGAFVLAATGLLDGRRATTHWFRAGELAEQHPDVEVDPSVLYVDEGRIITSAGAAAAMDTCLHVVRLDHGVEVANALARRLVVPPHRTGGQAQFVEAPVDTTQAPDALGGAMAWAIEHLDVEITVEDLAREAAMSPRHFARRFRILTGTTPYQWLLQQRVALAQRLLEATDLPVELIAGRAGFGSPAAMRVHFQRVAATSPQAYRRTFGRASA